MARQRSAPYLAAGYVAQNNVIRRFEKAGGERFHDALPRTPYMPAVSQRVGPTEAVRITHAGNLAPAKRSMICESKSPENACAPSPSLEV